MHNHYPFSHEYIPDIPSVPQHSLPGLNMEHLRLHGAVCSLNKSSKQMAGLRATKAFKEPPLPESQSEGTRRQLQRVTQQGSCSAAALAGRPPSWAATQGMRLWPGMPGHAASVQSFPLHKHKGARHIWDKPYCDRLRKSPSRAGRQPA